MSVTIQCYLCYQSSSTVLTLYVCYRYSVTYAIRVVILFSHSVPVAVQCCVICCPHIMSVTVQCYVMCSPNTATAVPCTVHSLICVTSQCYLHHQTSNTAHTLYVCYCSVLCNVLSTHIVSYCSVLCNVLSPHLMSVTVLCYAMYCPHT